MSARSVAVFVGVVIILAGAYYAFALPVSQEPITVRWLIAHQPTEVFDSARGVFEDALEREIGKPVTVELLQPSDIGYEEEVPAEDVMNMLNAGDVDLATIVVDSMMSDESDLRVLHLPYLFQDYASANLVLDGAAGDRLLAEVSKLTGQNALAFTYSGGFRVIATREKAIREPRDFAGMKISMWGGALVENGLASLGALPVRVEVGGGRDELASGESDGAQLTYTRATGSIGEGESIQYVTETNHILFLSTILAGEKFIARLSDGQQHALQRAADAAAVVEREDSIAFAAGVKEKLTASGVEILTLSDEARSAFEAWGAQFRAQFDGSENAKSLVSDILEAQGI